MHKEKYINIYLLVVILSQIAHLSPLDTFSISSLFLTAALFGELYLLIRL